MLSICHEHFGRALGYSYSPTPIHPLLAHTPFGAVIFITASARADYKMRAPFWSRKNLRSSRSLKRGGQEYYKTCSYADRYQSTGSQPQSITAEILKQLTLRVM